MSINPRDFPLQMNISSYLNLGRSALLCIAFCGVLSLSHAQEVKTRLVPATPTVGNGTTPVRQPLSDVGQAKMNTLEGLQQPINIDSGPRDLVPTEIYLQRFLTADFNGEYIQKANIYLPIYYHSGYLALSAEDQAELRRLEKEMGALMSEYENFMTRFGNFVAKYQALYARGKPAGVVSEADLLVPYAGKDSTVRDNLEPLKLVRSQTYEPGKPSANTSSPTPVKPNLGK